MGTSFIGIDVGTQGARIVLLDDKGNILFSAEKVFPLTILSREEQSVKLWWNSCVMLLDQLVKTNGKAVINSIKSIAVTSTSGTVIPLNAENIPLYNAIMYSDKRSDKAGKKCSAIAQNSHGRGLTTFNSSTGLAKMVWFKESFPEKFEKIKRWAHASDFISSKLSNVWGVTDYTNALKSGYDLTALCWPDYISKELSISKDSLPTVYPTGAVMGNIDKFLAKKLGLPENIQITSGLTDGCASQIASGAVELGDWNTTIGTTMVIKGVTTREILDPLGRLYSHRHPLGYWMPGGASNTGADWVNEEFSQNLDELNQKAKALIPSGFLNYPLRQLGERFPLNSPHALGFEDKGLNYEQRFAANMEGVAFIERFGYELIEKLSEEGIRKIYTAGGASNSEVWLKIRANVLGKPILKMRNISGAVGAAISGAAGTHYNNLIQATKALTIIDSETLPEQNLICLYNEQYLRFISKLKDKGYLNI